MKDNITKAYEAVNSNGQKSYIYYQQICINNTSIKCVDKDYNFSVKQKDKTINKDLKEIYKKLVDKLT